MRTLWTMAAIAFLTLGSSVTRADGLIVSLPKDGSWVKYLVEFTETDNENEMDVKRAAGSLKLASVGREIVNGRSCRWIELEMFIKQENRDRSEQVVLKLLIPEKQLARGMAPGKNIIRGWMRHKFGERSGSVKKVDALKLEGWMTHGLLAGAQKETGRLKPKIFPYQKGELRCPGISTRFDYPQEWQGETKQIDSTAKTYFHESVPFGVASLVINTKEFSGDFIEMNFTLNDFGAGAKTELPDHQ